MPPRLYTTSTEAWDAMLAAIRGAQASIFLEMYIFLDDTAESHDFIGALEEQARAGRRVVVVVDALGSQGLRAGTIARLRAAGGEVLFYSRWLRHIHRKILIVDRRVAFVGGVNIARASTHWNDLQLRLRGKIVRRLLMSFAYTYEIAGGRAVDILALRDLKLATRFKFWLIEHTPVRNIYTLKNHYIEHISQARHSITVVTPYFAPPRWLISLLDAALQRGVRVEILIPKRTDHHHWMDPVNYHFASVLTALGARVALTQPMNHAKLLLIDDRQALLGSQNIDWLSFHLNAEAGVFFSDPSLIQSLHEIINTWRATAEPFRLEHYRLRPKDYIVWILSKLLHPIL